MVCFNLEQHIKCLVNIRREHTHTLGNLPESVLWLNLREVDYLGGKILWYLSFVELTRNNLAELGRNHTRMRVVFARDVDTKYIRILNANVVRFLKVALYDISTTRNK